MGLVSNFCKSLRIGDKDIIFLHTAIFQQLYCDI